jgi:hypothetical protein
MRFVPIDEAEKPAAQFRFVPLEQPSQAAPQVVERAPEEFPPGIAGAGPMQLPRDFSIPVETPGQGMAPVAEESILPPEASISGFVKGPPARGFQPSLMAEQFKSGVTGMQEGYYANAAKNNAQLLNLMDRIDRGESVPPIEDVLGYADMDASAKAQTRDAIQSALAQTTAKTVAYGQERQGYKRNENADRMIKLADDGDLKGALKLFASDPLGILQQLSVESAPNALPSLIGGAAGVLLRGGVAGLMTGLATGSFPVEYMASISESLRESGVDLSDVKAVEAKLKDPDFLKAAGERAVTRARVISAADAATGALLLPFKAGQLGRNIARGAANVASEVGTEMVGEAGAQTATGEELKLGQVLAEGLGAGPQAVVSTALRTIAESAPKETPTPERVEPTLETEPAVTERVEPTLAEEEPVVLKPTVRGVPEEEPSAVRPAVREAPPAEAPTIPGLPSIEEFEAQEATDVAEGKAPEISTTPTPEAVAVQKQVAQEPPEETEKKAETEPNIAVGPPIVYPLVKSLKLSDDVPQFKEEADEQGVVERLEGKFDYRDAGAIQVWQRLNGDLEVISGRHRLDLARRNNIDRIPAQIYREADGFTAQDASILDAELNIRDEQGKVKDYVQYFQGSGITQEEADARGLLGRTKGKRGYAIANLGSPELVAAHRADLISDEAAAEIAKIAPNDARLQAVALSVRQRGGSNQDALNAVRAIQAMALEQATTTDMFGFDDSGIKQAVEMGRVAERKKAELGQRISILNNVSRNPKLAAQEGVDLKNPEAVQQRISELKAQRAAWDNWQTNPDLIAEVRAELAPTAPELQLTGETEAEITTREEAEQAGATEAEKKAQEVAKEATPQDRPDENDPGFRGASDEEVADVAEAFQKAKQSQDAETVTRVFDAPKKTDIVRIEDKARIFVKDVGYLTVDQAKQRIEEWKRNAEQQGETGRNSDKIVLSLFDMTGEWSKPWEEAGYQVYRFDIQTDPEMGDVNKFSSEFFNDLYGAFEGQDIYAILAACPCTDFASSGARHFAAKDADGRTVESVELVRQTLATVEYFKPSVWAIENPVGRIEKLTGLPPWRMSFNPNHFGDPYTKKTLLWGRFNANLPIAPVEPVEGSKMHRMYGGKSQATKNARSVTPEGFAYAFFQANNAIDNPVMAIANKYDMMSPEVIKQAVDAGMSVQQVSDVVDDPYFDADYKAADRALLDEVKRIKAERGEATPEAPAVAPEIERLQKTYDDAKSALDALGAEPPKPRTERQFFGKNGREGANPETVRRYDDGVKKYNSWKRKYGKLKKAEVDASNALFRATQPKGQGPTLANIEPSLAEQEGDLIFGSQRIREENIKEYARLRRKLAGVPKKVARGEAGIDVQRETARLLKTTQELKQEIEATKPRRDTPERFLAKALEEYDKGNISADVLAVVQAAYSKAPGLLNGLRLRVQKQPEGGASAADFNPLDRIVRLFKGTSGVNSPVSIRHELAHSLEQMMTPEQRQILVDQWYQSLEKAMQKHQDEKHQRYFKSVLDFMDNPNLRNFQTAIRNLPSYDMYQYLSPSEYWAVNAEPLMDAQLGTPWNRFKMAVRRLFEGLKDVFGFDNKSPVYKTFKQIMDSDGQRISQDMLVDHIQKVSDSLTLFNVEAPKEERERVDALLEEFNRPDVTGRATQTVRSDLMPSTTAIRSTFKEMIENPRQAINSMFGPLNRGIATVRNKAFFFGAGLEERDAERYGGQVVTSNDEATATLALDNMLHGRGIAAQFIMKGGLRYNPTTKRIEAHDADGSMVDVYQLEHQLKIKLGDERGAKLAQGYFEAKRSKSIRDEMAELAEVSEVQKEALDDARARLSEQKKAKASDSAIGQQQKVVDRLAQEYNETKTQLDEIVRINEEKVLMSEKDIEAFIDQDAVYPELRGMMNAWTATNHRLLGMMRQVRMISEKRYKRLMSIKDYVPWQRVQDDDVDIHFIGNPRAATNISKERSFKKGKVERPVDYIVDNMTDNIIRLTQSVLRQNAALRIVNDYATRDPETGKIKTFGKADPNKGRFDYISDGRRVIVEIQDPVIAESVYGLARDNLRMNAAIAGLTEFIRRSITIDPGFQVAQVIKDAPSAAMITGIRNAPVFMASVFGSFTKTVLNQDPVADILRANGIGGFQSAARTPEAAIKVQKGLIKRSPLAAVMAIMDHIGDSSDFASRIAVYKRTLAETKSDDMPNGDEALALYRAANVINFNRMGSSNVAMFFAKYVIFANAYMQSIDTLFRAMTARGMTGRDKSRAMAVFAGTTAQLASMTLLYSFLVGGDDEYEKLDDGTKTRNILIPKSVLGTENGILVPMNTSASFMFKALPELTYNMLSTQATKTPMDATRYRQGVAGAAVDAFLGPELVPTVIRPIVEISTGRSFFTERPLVPRGMESMEKFRQYTDQTSEIAKLMGKAGGLSPIEYDHLIRGTLGTAGLLAQYGSNLVGQYLDVRPEPTAKQAPFVGRFIAPTEGRGREDLFYDLHERVRKATSTLRDLEQTGEYKTAEKYEREKELLLDLSREMNRTEAKLKKINTEIRMLSRGREEGTAKERRKEIDLLQRDKSELLEGIELLRKEAGL